MHRITLIVAAVLVAAACSQNITDNKIHHYVTRIKADTLVDQRNAWCQWSTVPKPVVGQDVGDDACGWTNPTPLIHP